MIGFCDELREERERQGLSLEAIAWSTKISERHLRALESGDFAQLPGGVFRKGFLRSYLGALRVEEASWMERFGAALREAGVSEPDPAGYQELARNVGRTRGGRGEPEARLRWSGVVAMIALLLAFGWCVWHFALAGHVSIAARVRGGAPANTVVGVGAGPANAKIPRSAAPGPRRMHRFAAATRAA